MRSAHRHHPLAAAATALEHYVLRHFGFHSVMTDPKSAPTAKERSGRTPAP